MSESRGSSFQDKLKIFFGVDLNYYEPCRVFRDLSSYNTGAKMIDEMFEVRDVMASIIDEKFREKKLSDEELNTEIDKLIAKLTDDDRKKLKERECSAGIHFKLEDQYDKGQKILSVLNNLGWSVKLIADIPFPARPDPEIVKKLSQDVELSLKPFQGVFITTAGLRSPFPYYMFIADSESLEKIQLAVEEYKTADELLKHSEEDITARIRALQDQKKDQKDNKTSSHYLDQLRTAGGSPVASSNPLIDPSPSTTVSPARRPSSSAGGKTGKS